MHTPFGRDICKETGRRVHASRAEAGVLLLDHGLAPSGLYAGADLGKRQAFDRRADFARYIEYMKGQIRELMTNYGPIVHFGSTADGNINGRGQKGIQGNHRHGPRASAQHSGQRSGRHRRRLSRRPNNRFPPRASSTRTDVPAMWEACMPMTTGHGSFATHGLVGIRRAREGLQAHRRTDSTNWSTLPARAGTFS